MLQTQPLQTSGLGAPGTGAGAALRAEEGFFEPEAEVSTAAGADFQRFKGVQRSSELAYSLISSLSLRVS